MDGTPLSMKMDTGSSWSIISEATFHKCFPENLLSQSLVRLKTYSGDEVTVCGELSVTVEYEEQEVTLPLLVVKGGGQSLMGRDWLSSLKLNWQQIFNITDYQKQMEEVLSQYEDVFSSELGVLKEYEAKIFLEQNATPQFHKARPVPLSMKSLIEKELDNLVQQGVI